MFPGYSLETLSRAQADLQIAAHGLSVLEVRQDTAGVWTVVDGSPFARRITGATPCVVTGPAAGHRWLRTRADPTGRQVVGTIANCSAGKTPWGTVLCGEENWHLYFGNRDRILDEKVLLAHARYGVPRQVSNLGWERFHERFDLGVEPHEPFRFGWAVEVDPFDPDWAPRKRTALGRFRREAAASTVAPTGQVVLYSGDDILYEYIYKFVTREPARPGGRDANDGLLDDGTLYVARFFFDGTGVWHPLRHGVGPLTVDSGFADQADVLIRTAAAADAWNATKMDRPEDIRVSPKDGTVFVALTNNPLRGTAGSLPPDGANPRPRNTHGHIVEIHEAGGNHASTAFRWRIFLLCGDPDDPSTYFAGFPKDRVSAISCPDNLTFDVAGNLWIATDGQPRTLATNDGLYAVPVAGPERGWVRRFFSGVPGSEICSPEFTPDNRTLFLAVQHPGEGTTLDAPSSRWPFGDLPRPAVVAIQEDSGGQIGVRRP
jgi:secreted PhoX family phosphatase